MTRLESTLINVKRDKSSLRPLSSTSVEEAVKEVFGNDVFGENELGLNAKSTEQPTELRDVTYSFEDLSSWYGEAQKTAVEYGLVFADIDEYKNVIALGINNKSGIEALRGQLTQAGVPSDALSVEFSEPIRLLRTLKERYRPVLGGLYVAR